MPRPAAVQTAALRSVLTGALLSVGLSGCGHLAPSEAEQRLQDAVSAAVESNDGVRNAVLHVHAPRVGINARMAAGVAVQATGAPMTPDTPFLAASVGKLFVAATVLALFEEQERSLDEPVTAFVASEQLTGLPVVGGDEALSAITVAMLLGHRSGLPDYFDPAVPTKDGAPSVLELIAMEPERTWTRQQLIDYTRAHWEPAAAPGEQFRYSDLNYDLLSLVIEGATGRPFHEEVRARVIAPLGLTGTWYHAFEPAPVEQAPYADAFWGATNLARIPALSADQAGGGLITTAADLRRFMRALVGGSPVSLPALAGAWSDDALNAGIDYAYGLWRIRPGGIFFLFGSLPDLLGVHGATGSFAYYDATHDAVITGTFNQFDYQEDSVAFLLSDVLSTLNQLPPLEDG